MARVLLVSPYFPPRRRVGALRAFRFATHLRDLGHEVGVVHLSSRGEPTERESRRLRGVVRFTLPARFDSTEATHDRSGASSMSRLARWTDRSIPVDTWLPLFVASAPRVARLSKEFRPELVFSTADPWSSHLLGYVAKRAARAAWIADFRDPWTLCEVRNAGRPAWTRRADRIFESQAMRRADLVTFTASETARRYAGAYPAHASRIRVVENAYDSAMLPAGVARPDPRAVSRDGVLRLLFFGAFRPLSPATPIIRALFELRRSDPALAARVEVCSMGALGADDAALARGLGVERAFRRLERVPYESAQAPLRAADVLLLSTDPRRAEILPAKLWDYMPALRPILNLSPNQEAARLIARARLGVSEPANDAGAIARRLAACLRAMDEGAALPLSFDPDLARVAAHDAPRVARELERLMLELLALRGAV